MNDYDFSTLNDKEFENISTDLLSEYLGAHIERFRAGRDGGVDGRFYSDDKKEVIIQCKHWLKSGTDSLIKYLKNTELSKIKKLSPSRYILVTSVELSRKNKKAIKDNLSPYIKCDSDIIGKEDLNTLLGKYPSIEERHYKLWLSSTTVLKSILNSGVIGRSASKFDDIKDKISLYVQTENHSQALELLESSHVTILTGEPGIGKTTLADHLCLYYESIGYQLVYIEDSLSEADDVYKKDPKEKQLFYYDDFLGRNYLMALQRHEDSHVLSFIKRVSKSKNKRFILTSRTNIYNQGKRLSELFYIDNIDKNEYEIRIDSLTDFDRACILYNHIWFSELSEEHIDSLYKDKRYRIIIDHKNYNPRLISFITDSHKLSGISIENYWNYILDTLNNPSGVWTHVFDQQIDDFSRAIVRLVNFNGRYIYEDELHEAFEKYIKLSGISKTNNISSSFDSTIKVISGALIVRNISSNGDHVFYTLFNPSIGDYLLSLDKANKNIILDLCKSLNTTASLDNLINLKNNKFISKAVYKNIINKIIDLKINDNEVPDGYRYKLASLGVGFSDTGRISGNIKKFIIYLNEENIHSDDIGEFVDVFTWALIHLEPDESGISVEIECHINESEDHDDLVNLSYLIDQLSYDARALLTETLNRKVEEFWVEYISDYISENYILEEYTDPMDTDSALIRVESEIEDKMSEYYTDASSINIDNIYYNCDVSSIIQQNIENEIENAYESSNQRHQASSQYSNAIDPIDDLFDREH